MSKTPFTNECPYCRKAMQVSECTCKTCEIAVRGDFPAVPLGNLPTEHQRFIEMFMLASGNLKEIATHAGVSYPTVRSRLDKVIAALRSEIEMGQKQNKTRSGKSKKNAEDKSSAAEIIKRI